MFYYLSKIFWFLVQPSSLIAILLSIALVFIWRRRVRAGRRLLAGSLGLYLLLGWSPLTHLLTLPLENRFARPDSARHGGMGGDVAAIIVLGGGVDTQVSLSRRVISLNEAGERVVEGVMLARAHPQARLIISGTGKGLLYAGLSDGAAMGQMFARLLKDPDRVVVEDRSRNTWQNAIFVKRLLKPQPGQRFLLVTSAFHMPRAVGYFRKAGMTVVPWPTDYRTRGWADLWRFYDRPAEGLRRADLIIREWIGLAAYWLTGRTGSLLPGPEH